MEVIFRDDVKAVMDVLAEEIPGAKAGKSFGHPAYKVGKKVFAFVGGDGIAIKLPEARVSELVETHTEMHPFYPTKGTLWKAWVSIIRDNAEDYRQDISLMEESIQYITS